MLWGIINIDDNNLPALENSPDNMTTNQTVLADQFEHSGICPRCMEGASNVKLKIQFSNVQSTHLQLFELFFMNEYLQNILIPETNKNMKGKALSYFVWN